MRNAASSGPRNKFIKEICSMFNFSIFKNDVKYVVRRLAVGLPLSYLILKLMGYAMLFLGALVGEL